MKNHINCKIDDIYKSHKSNKEIFVVKNLIFWIEPINKKKEVTNAIFVRTFNQKKSHPQNLTGEKFYIKNYFHGYGGKSYKCFQKENKIYIFWIDQLSKSIWGQVFKINNPANDENYLLPIEGPNKLTNTIKGNFDGCFCLSNNDKLFGLVEINERDYLFSINISGINQDLKILKKFKNFGGDLSSNSSANFLSWIEWDTPHMPWEKNDLFFAEIDAFGDIIQTKRFAHKSLNEKKNVSFFQPYWISDEILVCSEDSSLWWNLLFIDVSEFDNINVQKRINRNFFEYGTPQWVSGITFFSGNIKNLFCLAKKENTWIIQQYQNLILIKEICLPFCSISDFNVFGEKLALKGHGSNFKEDIFEVDFAQEISSYFVKEISYEYVEDSSKPESFWFKGFDNKSTHSFLYRPLVERFTKPPLLIRAHSGPTACFEGSYNSEVQYWTSKGFFVAEVNYGGSSGFGREYRERLNNKWGIVDSYDCKSLVLELLKLELVDTDRIAISGNSAGGLTALNSLCDYDIFKAAICKYPVIDLRDMYENTHRFERDYLNSLVGDYEKCLNDYDDRSPINKICKIKKPILIFHGKRDSVISYKQTLKIKEQMIHNNKHSEVIFFEDEGHGFNNILNKKKVIEKTEGFLKKIFSF
tara:strand:- start:678 stop:2600 length:1923 start_codon:yes stop_codon:yes gene_type:complete